MKQSLADRIRSLATQLEFPMPALLEMSRELDRLAAEVETLEQAAAEGSEP